MIQRYSKNAATFVKQIKELPGYRGQVIHLERLKARRARYAQPERPLPPALLTALRQVGAGKFYRHQAQAIKVVRRGQQVILATATPSGKTLAYNVPVMEALLADWPTRALYLFSIKALARDQLRGLRELGQGNHA